MKLLQGQAIGLVLAAVLSVPAWAGSAGNTSITNNARSNSAVPGTLNYVEGQVDVSGQSVDHNSVGKTTVEVGQSLNTQTGKAEILLTPGVFLREGDNSSVTVVANGLADTQIKLTQGHAMVEVDQIYPQNNLTIVEGDATARITKAGLYDFDLQQHQMRVFDGEAMVQQGEKQIKLKGDRELAIADNSPDKAVKFNKNAMNGDDLYRWSSLRSDYVAEANVDAARIVVAGGWGGGFWGPGLGWGWGGYGLAGYGGWYWDPWFSAYTFMPLDGIFYSPFGWGFYSPGLVWRAPFYGGHFSHTFNASNVRAWGPGPHYASSRSYAHGVYTGAGAERGAFNSGALMARGGMGGGGFRGGEGGGFHGGGGGGGGGHAGR